MKFDFRRQNNALVEHTRSTDQKSFSAFRYFLNPRKVPNAHRAVVSPMIRPRQARRRNTTAKPATTWTATFSPARGRLAANATAAPMICDINVRSMLDMSMCFLSTGQQSCNCIRKITSSARHTDIAAPVAPNVPSSSRLHTRLVGTPARFAFASFDSWPNGERMPRPKK